MSENIKKIQATLEALLFIHGEPIDIKKIVKILQKRDSKINEEAVKNDLEELSDSLKSSDRGLRLIFADNKIQLATKPEFSSLFEQFIKEELSEELTPASLETLAIIAYGATLPRSVIDYIRGVNSTFILRTLLLRGLILREPDPKRKNVYLYKPSFDFLKYMGLGRTEDLPEYGRFREVIEKLKPQT